MLGFIRHYARDIVSLADILENWITNTEDTRAQIVWAQNEVSEGWDNDISHFCDCTWANGVVLSLNLMTHHDREFLKSLCNYL